MKRANWILGAIALMIAPPTVYFLSYVFLGESYYEGSLHIRSYKSYRMARVFDLAATVETWATGQRTLIGLTVEWKPSAASGIDAHASAENATDGNFTKRGSLD